MFSLVYFSSQSENTRRFVTRLGLPARRIPLDAREALHIDQPYIWWCPATAVAAVAVRCPVR